VRRFEYVDWADLAEQPPPWWDEPHAWPSWSLISAWRRWSDACEQWAAGRPEIDLYAIHYPETAANLRAAGLMPASPSARPRQ
jgi:hypothetical protein